jgi:hypothetical protein
LPTVVHNHDTGDVCALAALASVRGMADWKTDDPRRTPILLRKDLLAQGHNDKSIKHMVEAGALCRIRYGTYVDAAAWSSCDKAGRHAILTRAVLKRARAAVVPSHLSAAVEWEVPFWDLALDTVHITRLDERAGRREVGVVQHLGELPDDHVVSRNGVRLTSAPRTALDCATLLDLERSIALIGDLLHRQLTTKNDLYALLEFMKQWPGSLQNKLAIDLADERCESVGEHRTLFMCWKQGLPRPVPQYEVERDGQVVARLDFAWPGHRVWLEFDGRVKYQELLRKGETPTDVVLREKEREKLISRLTGWECIRITWADLRRPEKTAAMIREVLFRGVPVAS